MHYYQVRLPPLTRIERRPRVVLELQHLPPLRCAEQRRLPQLRLGRALVSGTEARILIFFSVAVGTCTCVCVEPVLSVTSSNLRLVCLIFAAACRRHLRINSADHLRNPHTAGWAYSYVFFTCSRCFCGLLALPATTLQYCRVNSRGLLHECTARILMNVPCPIF